MISFAIVIFCLLAAAAAVVAQSVHRPRVVVTTKQGDSIRGARALTFRPVVALHEAEVLSEQPQKLAGRVEIPVRNVAMVQVLEPRRFVRAAVKA